MPLTINNKLLYSFKILFSSYLIYFYWSTNTFFDSIISKNGLFSTNQSLEAINWLRWLNLDNYNFFWIVGVILSILFLITNNKSIKIISWLWWISWCFSFPYYLYPPHIAYIGYTLLFFSFISKDNKIHPYIFLAFFLSLSLSFTTSGLAKILYSSSWIDGTSLIELGKTPAAREIVLWVNNYPWLSKLSSYFAVSAEILVFPLALFSRTRKASWLLMMGIQIFILLSMKIPDLSIAMIICLLIFYPQKRLGQHEK